MRSFRLSRTRVLSTCAKTGLRSRSSRFGGRSSSVFTSSHVARVSSRGCGCSEGGCSEGITTRVRGVGDGCRGMEGYHGDGVLGWLSWGHHAGGVTRLFGEERCPADGRENRLGCSARRCRKPVLRAPLRDAGSSPRVRILSSIDVRALRARGGVVGRGNAFGLERDVRRRGESPPPVTTAARAHAREPHPQSEVTTTDPPTASRGAAFLPAARIARPLAAAGSERGGGGGGCALPPSPPPPRVVVRASLAPPS